MQRVVVLGGTGELGSLVVTELTRRGHSVGAAARSSGVDVSSGAGLEAALSGADTVVDCLNLMSLSRRASVDFFGGAAARVAAAARTARVGHLVCLSILNVTHPGVATAVGYYAGKAAQEVAYLASGLPVTIARTTAWFTLGGTFLHQLRVGSTALVSRMPLQPMAPEAAARFVVDRVERGPAPGEQPAIAGPVVIDSVALARAIGSVTEPNTRIIGLPMPFPALRRGALLPGPDIPRDPQTLQEWLAARPGGG